MLPIGAKYKIARRLGPIFEKTQTQKFAIRQQNRKPVRRRRQASDFNKQLIEKQKLRLTYGLKERKLSEYVKNALASSQDTNPFLYETLERRLDSAVYRAGFADTRRMARQLTSHGHITVNGRNNNIPSMSLKAGDVIAIKDGKKDKAVHANLAERRATYKAPSWMKTDFKKMAATISELPSSDRYEFDFKRIIEFYTR
jgi:small subunit ribosomal protein S4